MLRSRTFRLSLLMAALCLMIPSSGEAQHEPTAAEMARAVECFVLDTPPRKSNNSNCTQARLISYLVPQLYPMAVAEQALDGLEELATTSADLDVRRHAILSIGHLGSHPKTEVQVMDRLTRIYRANSSPGVARAVLQAAGWNTDTSRAAQLLGEIATRTGEDPYHRSIPAMAVEKLYHMGETGRAILRSLYEEDRVSDEAGAALLRSAVAEEQ